MCLSVQAVPCRIAFGLCNQMGHFPLPTVWSHATLMETKFVAIHNNRCYFRSEGCYPDYPDPGPRVFVILYQREGSKVI